jgi:hypothetical protein
MARDKVSAFALEVAAQFGVRYREASEENPDPSEDAGLALIALAVLASYRLRFYEGVRVSCSLLAEYVVSDDGFQRAHLCVVRMPVPRAGQAQLRFRITARGPRKPCKWEFGIRDHVVVEAENAGEK